MLTPARVEKIKDLVRQRQTDLTLILENIHDPHNIGAILRSCDGVGISEIYVIYSEESKNSEEKYVGRNASSGATKWVKVHFFKDIQACFSEVRKKYDFIWATHLGEKASSLYELDLSQKVALAFGNERDGLSEEVLRLSDGNYIIPMHGMIQSLNVSVACAISLFEASRQRDKLGRYDQPFDSKDPIMVERFKAEAKKDMQRIFTQDPAQFDILVNELLTPKQSQDLV